MPSAIPFKIHLYAGETEEWYIPPQELLARLTSVFPDAELDKERGKREVLEHMQEMLDMGTPELIVQGLPALAEQTTYVTVRWADWPGNRVTAHLSGLETGNERLVFSCEIHDFEFLKFAAGKLTAAFNMHHFLQTRHSHSIETESWPAPFDPLEWIRDSYAQIDEYSRFDPATESFSPPKYVPTLSELPNWPETLHRALCRYLNGERRVNAELRTHGFAGFEEYATAYVKELSEFAPVRHCWSVELDASHHNEVLIDHGNWLTRVRLSGVPKGILS